MSGHTSDLFQAKRGAAILAACIAQTMNESDPSFQARFLKRLEAAYYSLWEEGADRMDEMEMVSWVREILLKDAV